MRFKKLYYYFKYKKLGATAIYAVDRKQEIMKKLYSCKVISAALFVISIAIILLCYNSYQDNRELKHQVAHANYLHWSELLHMTRDIENKVRSVEDIKSYFLYQNTIIHNVQQFSLKPDFKNGFNPTILEIYDAFVLDLSTDKIPEEQGMELYLEVNTGLYYICEFVVSSVNNKHDLEYQLLDENSEFYKEVNDKIVEFCDKYYSRISEFN